MRDHREGQDPTLRPLELDGIKRAFSSLHEVSARRMARVRAINDLYHGRELDKRPRPPKVKRGRTTVGKPGGKAGKILRGQR